ncbi:AAA family ATPase [Bacillus anthracis]|uniref:AAA family ATPase n=1 Tax=Bacillus anthracis TaxID=1392 RepID=UPI002DB976D1|nr:AAA family ATPase [Bacillus anthracis]MEB9457381.1 AAA family ATPase [Bacillus anthracis]
MNFSAIEVKGACFKENSEFIFFDKINQKSSIIYGKNGSGKSSLSRAFYEKRATLTDTSYTRNYDNLIFKELDNTNTTSHVISEETLKEVPIFVYNEDFILNNVHFKEEGLDTIVMLGIQQDISEKIANTELEISKYQQELSDLKEREKVYLDRSSTDSPNYYLEKIKEKLRRKWAERQRKILGNKTNSAVSDQVVHNLMRIQERAMNLEHLEEIYTTKYSIYETSKQASLLPVPQNIHNISEDIEKIRYHLALEIPIPDLTEREKKILNIIEENNNKFLKQSTDILSLEDRTHCPVCYQDLSNDYKQSALKSLSLILETEEAKLHIRDLETLNINHIQLDLSAYNNFEKKDKINELKELYNEYNRQVDLINHYIYEKKINVYIPVHLEFEILEVYKSINVALDEFKQQIEEFNVQISKIEAIKQELIEINIQIAFKESIEDYINYSNKEQDYKLLYSNMKQKSDTLKTLGINLDRFKAQLANIEIACDTINKFLSFIFYDKNRLTLHANNNRYIIKSRGEHIQLKSLSIGERNAVALSYFFSLMLQDKSEEDKFSSPCILVLDDPISSFDFENKVGIYSFLRFILNQIHSGNDESKAIFFTHDLEVFYNVEKIYKDIGIKDKNVSKSKLMNHILIPFKDINNDYSLFLQQIYEYACGQNQDLYENSIGNTMRKVLEAFGTFNYKMGIDKLTTDSRILNQLPNEPKYQEHFSNSMYRLVLHGDSHLEDRAKIFIDRDFYSFIDRDEKVRTAKDILIFLKLLNPIHLETHLTSKNDDIASEIKLGHINSWEAELFEEELIVS